MQYCTAVCQCLFKGHDAVAVFIGSALQMHYSTSEAPETRLVSHIAGKREAEGSQDGPGWLARFHSVSDMTYVPTTNKLIVCDSTGRTVRSVHLESPFTVSTLCGHTTMSGEYVDGSVQQSRFDSPYNVCVAPNGVNMYVTDYGNHAVRKIDTRNGTVETIFGCGGNTTYCGREVDRFKCTLMFPMGIEVDPTGQFLYVVNFGCNSICEVQVDPERGNEGRLVRAFAMHKAKFALKTAINVTPRGYVIVWRQNANSVADNLSVPDPWSDDGSSIALFNPRTGNILFTMAVSYTPRAFCMSFPSRNNKGAGTVIHALTRNGGAMSCDFTKTSLTLSWQVMKLLLLGMHKPDTTHPQGGTMSTFALIPLSILQYIVTFVNDPFSVMVH